jgi:hypothetical protein
LCLHFSQTGSHSQSPSGYQAFFFSVGLLKHRASIERNITDLAPFTADTSMGIAYDRIFNYRVTAGIGPLNSSYVPRYLQHLQNLETGYSHVVVPYSVQAIVFNLVTNPVHSVARRPVRIGACAQDHCDSYLLRGGLISATPWPPIMKPSAPVIQFVDTPACQIDFQDGLRAGDVFSDHDWTLSGANTTRLGVKFCLARS